ncbi:MAG: hypothetical protein C0525_09025 [Flavobacterium sp.]|uniref:hypothetical protein n=1 Tax=Flavobacterium sp. TaxID=239 RepID=UPI0025BA9356|nr:hypothetical protein [Flavobacterium sp.]MBA4134855.1 hypothetical protein [Flavobacterium sp.]
MKTYYLFSQRLSLFSVLGILTITATSCGSYQNTSYYDDGIYGSSENKQTQSTTNSESNKYKEYFSNTEIFTDVDNYSNVSTDSVSNGQAYDRNNAGWGENAQSVTVNVYDNNWGWGYWNNYWYGSYWGWGWNNWYGPGWGWGWNSWYGPSWNVGWGLGWNSWNNWYGPGWGGYYGHNHWGSYYNGGRRGTAYSYGNRLNSSYNNRYQSNGVRSNRSFNAPRSSNFNTRPNTTPVRTNSNTAPTRTNINNSSSQPRNSVRTQTQSTPSRSYTPSSNYGGGRSSGGGGSYGGGRSSGGGRR